MSEYADILSNHVVQVAFSEFIKKLLEAQNSMILDILDNKHTIKSSFDLKKLIVSIESVDFDSIKYVGKKDADKRYFSKNIFCFLLNKYNGLSFSAISSNAHYLGYNIPKSAAYACCQKAANWVKKENQEKQLAFNIYFNKVLLHYFK